MWFSTFLMVVATIWVGGLPSVCAQCTSPCVPGSEAIMDQKDHETSAQKDLKWGCRTALADRMCVSLFLTHKENMDFRFMYLFYPCVGR